MIIMLVIMTVVFYATLSWCYFHAKDTLKFAATTALGVTLIGGGFLGTMAWTFMYTSLQDEVPVQWNITEGPNGRYLDSGTTGETNTPIYYYYYRSGGGIERSYRYSESSGIVYTEDTPHVEATCPSAETLPEWVMLPWENNEGYEFEPDCAHEYFTFYIPKEN